MKGDRKCRKTQFPTGNTPHNKRACLPESHSSSFHDDATDEKSTSSRITTRMDTKTFSLTTIRAADQTLTAPDCDGKPGSIRLLRPKPCPQQTALNLQHATDTSTKDSIQGTRMVDNVKMVEMFNQAIKLHITQTSICTEPQFTIANEKKWGLGWKYTLKCLTCNFLTPEYKLYNEVRTQKPGPNPAAVNLTLQAGLQDSPVGNTRARVIIASVDIPPPARSSMQRTSNIVGTATVQLNKSDMNKKLEQIRAINEDRGVVNPSQINVAMDVRYNTCKITDRKKCGQNASQAIGIVCETVTEKKFIVGAALQNKLCWTGAWLKGKGMAVDCPGGHPECTANLGMVEPLSEFELGQEIGGHIARQKMLIKHATTDGDARSAQGIDAAMKILEPMWHVERLADPTHLGQSQFRKSQRATYSEDMFPGTTRGERKTAQRVFSQDIKARCSKVFKNLMAEFCGNVEDIKKVLPKVLEATLKCYSGDCTMCRRHSRACSGGDTNNWWLQSMYLGTHRISTLNMNSEDKVLVKEILMMKLSEEAVMSMRFNTDTQKCEAVNRSIAVSLPKNTNFGRNAPGRLASTVLRMNNGLRESLNEKAENLGTRFSPRVQKSLEQIDNEMVYHRTYQNKPDVKSRLFKKRGDDMYEHLRYRQSVTRRVSDYDKGQLDDIHAGLRGDKPEHSYSK